VLPKIDLSESAVALLFFSKKEINSAEGFPVLSIELKNLNKINGESEFLSFKLKTKQNTLSRIAHSLCEVNP
jgi:hypothetical protein